MQTEEQKQERKHLLSSTQLFMVWRILLHEQEGSREECLVWGRQICAGMVKTHWSLQYKDGVHKVRESCPNNNILQL